MTARRQLAEAIVRDAARRYLATRRARIGPFVDRHFTFAGSLGLHRRAVGWDLLRAPANLVLAIPALILRLAGRGARRAGRDDWADWVARHPLAFTTDLAREIEWLVMTELLELACVQPGRASARDALAEAILADPRAAERLAAPPDPAWRDKVATAMLSYTGTRTAAAEIATGAFAAGLGALTVKQATPGLVVLGSALAGAMAQQSAIAAFPLGAALGRLWYGWYPVGPDPALLAATITPLCVAGAAVAAFSGILTDPLQRLLGVHRRRLFRLLDTIESALCGDRARDSLMRDHYVARLIDLLDLAATAWGVARG